MKKILLYAVVAILTGSCSLLQQPYQKRKIIKSAIDLVNMDGDLIRVSIKPAPIKEDVATFYIPETVPGTYSDDNYGRFVDSLSAFTAYGGRLETSRTSENTWTIQNAKKLALLNYYVNDTYDVEASHDIFSPAGTNFEKDTQFMLNLHGILGYFKNQEELPYYLDVHRPKKLQASTSLPRFQDSLYLKYEFISTESDTIDTFKADRYFDIIDNPIMYSSGNSVTWDIDSIQVGLSVYSPTNLVRAKDLQPNIERMMRAQKNYLGDFNTTKKYNILLYLANGTDEDATSFGALEHHTSTVTVLPEGMPTAQMDAALLDIVSHEFFHIVTPLNLHSTQIHKFKYNDPEMSKHLWMYEGVTEYFAQHFQVQQGLITPAEFYNVILNKIQFASAYNDAMSFTEMSERVLEEPYSDNYGNVYEKGALIGMCLDILIREHSNGEKGILDLMKELTSQYGPNRPFEDGSLIPQITKYTSPEVGRFFEKHVIGTIPIQYKDFFEVVGLEYNSEYSDTGFFLDGKQPYINATEKGVIYIMPIQLHTFFEEIGIQGDDQLISINGTAYNLDNAAQMINASNTWEIGAPVTFVIERDGQEMILEGKITQPKLRRPSITEIKTDEESPAVQLRNKWLKGS